MNRPVLRPLLLWCGLLLLLFHARPAGAGESLAAAEVALGDGLWAFNQGRHEEAAGKFREAAALNPRDGSPRYWLGLALLRLGRAEEAAAEIAASLRAKVPPEVGRRCALADLGAAQLAGGAARAAEQSFREAVEEAPGDAAALLCYAAALEGLGRREEAEAARARARSLDAEPEPAGPADSAAPRLGIAEPPRWEGKIGLAVAGDSNPNLLPEELTLLTPDGGFANGADSDQATELEGRLAFNSFLSRGWSLGVGLDARQAWHQELDYLDLGRVRAVVQLARGREVGSLLGPLGTARVPVGYTRLSLLLQGGTSYYQLDGDPYLRTLDAAAAVTLRETNATATQIDLLFQDRHFSGPYERRTGRDLNLAVSQLFLFGRRDRYLGVGVRGADRTGSRAFAASLLEGIAELSLPLAPRWTFYARGALEEQDFDHPESNLFQAAGEPRQDTTLRLTAALVWAAADRLQITARGTYIDRDSNLTLGPGIPGLDYERTVASLGAAWFFW
jgi:tetratricopeptide (TPR) repeat protein